MISDRLPNAEIQKKFNALCLTGKLTASRIMLAAYPEIDINHQDAISGQTLLHSAYLNDNQALLDFLRAHHANETIRDKKNNLAIEYQLNPNLNLTPRMRDFNLASRVSYRDHIIYIANKKLAAEGVSAKIIFIKNIEEINVYLNTNPHANRIGFVVEIPNTLKSTPTTDHVSPIFFERINNIEYFIQIDSTCMPACFVLPQSTNPNMTRRHFYSTFPRQVGPAGCKEDAIIILLKLLATNGLVNFAIKNCVSNKLADSLSPQEMTKLQSLLTQDGLNRSEVQQTIDLYTRKKLAPQKKILSILGLSPVTETYELTHLPKILLPHIQRFDTMRFFRVNKPEQFTKPYGKKTCLSVILQSQNIRFPQMLPYIDANLTNSDPRYDFGGLDFSLRKERFLQSFFTHQEVASILLLQKKFKATDIYQATNQLTGRDKKIQSISENDLTQVTNNILKFL